jgi:hypothetical protein
LGKAATGPAPADICSAMPTIRCGPTVQFAPVRSAPQEEISRAARSGSPSASVSPSSTKVLYASTGAPKGRTAS